jgi:hypothetical protein
MCADSLRTASSSQLQASTENWQKKNGRKKHKKLTAQPHARAGSMEVDGYENPAAAEKQGFTSRGGSRTHALFRFTTRPRRISPQYR